MGTLLLGVLAAFVFFLKAVLFFAASMLIGVGVLALMAFVASWVYVAVEFFRA